MGVTVTLSAAGVLILRPLAKRLGDLIEATAREKRANMKDEELGRLTELVGNLTDRIEGLEDRLDFNERVLASIERSGPTTPPRLTDANDR